jgi:MFS family permease
MAETTTTLHCANHPDRETVLRCNRCDKPICYQCAVRTPVGYRCKECVRGQQAVYYNGQSYDLAIAAGIALVLAAGVGAVAYALLGMLGFYSFIVAIFAGPVAGGLIAEAVRRGVGRRRARYLNWTAAGACVVGILLGGVLLYTGLPIWAGAPFRGIISVLPAVVTRLDVLLLAALAASTIYARLV